ncbi:MAG: helix-turn-helix domain-containing protein [Thiobacillus sp.]
MQIMELRQVQNSNKVELPEPQRLRTEEKQSRQKFMVPGFMPHAAICATRIECCTLCTTRIHPCILAMTIDTVGDLVRAARNSRSQKDFADLLGVKQSSVSRYERGKASPPISVIEHCMRLVHNQGEAPTAEQLAERIRVELADPSLIEARSALSRLVDAFVAEH